MTEWLIRFPENHGFEMGDEIIFVETLASPVLAAPGNPPEAIYVVCHVKGTEVRIMKKRYKVPGVPRSILEPDDLAL